MHNSRLPELYLRGYPEWAIPVSQLSQEIKRTDKEVCAQILAAMSKFLLDGDAEVLVAKYYQDKCSKVKPIQKNEWSKYLSGLILQQEPLHQSDMVDDICKHIPPGHILKFVALWIKGVDPQNIKLHTIKAERKVDTQPKHTSPTSGDEKQFEYELYNGSCCTYEITGLYGMHNYAQNHDNSVICSHFGLKGHCSETLCKNCKTVKKRPCCTKGKCSHEEDIKKLLEKNDLLEKELVTKSEIIDSLKSKVQVLENCLSELKSTLCEPLISFEKIKRAGDPNSLIQLHTGLPTVSHFQWLFDQLSHKTERMQFWNGKKSTGTKKYQDKAEKKPGPSRTLSPENELLLTLARLKLDIIEDYLSLLFGVSSSTVSKIITTWVTFVANEMDALIHWPTMEEVLSAYPVCFMKWPRIRSIIDCFEIPCDRPTHVEANSLIFSSYKNRTTTKFLISMSPSGQINYCSDAAGGNMSDKEIVTRSGFPEKFDTGDQVMADKGFKIEGELLEKGVELIIPPFAEKGKRFSLEKSERNRDIAHARIHIERVINRVRDYRILSGPTPITELDLIGPMVKVCCILTNMKGSVVPLD